MAPRLWVPREELEGLKGGEEVGGQSDRIIHVLGLWRGSH